MLTTKSGIPKYIGKTNNMQYRRYQHIWESKNGANYKKACWLRSCDYEFNMVELDVVDKNMWCFWESYWIDLFNSWGFELLNHTNGCDGRSGDSHSEETKRKMSEAKKGKKPKNLDNLIKLQKSGGKKTYQFSLEGKLINTYVSRGQASRDTGITNIYRAIRNRKTAGGYFWSYDKNYSAPRKDVFSGYYK